jgi:hypothetical protein
MSVNIRRRLLAGSRRILPHRPRTIACKAAPVSATIAKPAFHVPGNGRGHYADFGSF